MDVVQTSFDCSDKDALRVNFDQKLKLEFHGYFWILVDLATNFVKNTSAYCNSRKILILSWHRKAWLHSQAFNMGNTS
jgi:hypothetical protein